MNDSSMPPMMAQASSRTRLELDMSRLVRRCSPVLLVLVASSLGCGGSKPNQARPVTSESSRAEPEEESPSESTRGPSCSDGTCFACGQGLCLPGFFCDESSAQPNCQWMAKCGRSAHCACVSELLGSSCKCSERSGGIYVKCST